MQGSITMCFCFRGWILMCVYCGESIIPTVIRLCQFRESSSGLSSLPHGPRGCQAGSDPARSSQRTETGAATRLGLISNLTQYGRRFGQRPAGLYNTSTSILRETDKSLFIWCKQDYTGLDSCLLSLRETSKARAERMSQIKYAHSHITGRAAWHLGTDISHSEPFLAMDDHHTAKWDRLTFVCLITYYMVFKSSWIRHHHYN